MAEMTRITKVLCCLYVILEGGVATGGRAAMAEQVETTIRNSISRERNVISISCQGEDGDLHDALCKALYRQIKNIIPGYVVRRMPNLSAAPTRAKDVRVRLITMEEVGNMTLQMEWYRGSSKIPDRGPAVHFAHPVADTPQSAMDAVTVLLDQTPGFLLHKHP